MGLGRLLVMPGVMFGMLVVETIGKIRRLHESDGRQIKAICRRRGVLLSIAPGEA
jgi:hypothetical protein